MKKEKVLDYIGENMKIHEGKYLDREAAVKYQQTVGTISGNDAQDIGLRRYIRQALMQEYGITEIEAINILNGYHVADYIKNTNCAGEKMS